MDTVSFILPGLGSRVVAVHPHVVHISTVHPSNRRPSSSDWSRSSVAQYGRPRHALHRSALPHLQIQPQTGMREVDPTGHSLMMVKPKGHLLSRNAREHQCFPNFTQMDRSTFLNFTQWATPERSMDYTPTFLGKILLVSWHCCLFKLLMFAYRLLFIRCFKARQ